MNKRILGGLAAAAMLAGGLALTSGTAQATQADENGEHKVFVCHATSGLGELKNGYNLIEVDIASTQGEAHLAHATTDPKNNSKFGVLYDYIDVDPNNLPGACGAPASEPVERPVLTASFDCVADSASASLTPATSVKWTAGPITEDTATDTFSVTITPAAGFYFADSDDDSITLTAAYTETSDCEAIVAAPTLTSPSCLVDGSVVAVNTTDYTFSNTGNTYTATAVAGRRLVGQTVFVMAPLPKVTGAACAATTNTPTPDVVVAALPPIQVAPAPAVAPAASLPAQVLPSTGIDGTGTTAIIALLLTSLGGAALFAARRRDVTI